MMKPYFQFSGGVVSALLFMVALFFLFVFLPVSMVAEAFSKLGLTPAQGVLMLIAILVGRMVNIPVYTSERLVVVSGPRLMQFGMDEAGRPVRIEQEPESELRKQVFAVNAGGLILPFLLSVTFLIRQHMVFQADGVYPWIGFVLIMVAGGCYAMAKPDALTGMRIPLVLPALITFLCVYFFVPEPFRPVAAYVSGTMGAILGGNLIPLMTRRFRNSVGTPLVVIGGPGTFGGVFVAGILSVLLA
ncbi:membrane protein [Pseudodesulfovibrio portus]|uniref:Membrane protein n=2 Tax=Pseudodesulfovibrio portus TaxID=231439 RepID=A0ABM8ANL2_9BACT|nr:membrane protein [Pseudodesulfovibrio portus]